MASQSGKKSRVVVQEEDEAADGPLVKRTRTAEVCHIKVIRLFVFKKKLHLNFGKIIKLF